MGVRILTQEMERISTDTLHFLCQYTHPHLPSPSSQRATTSPRERQGSALKYCERPESGDNALYLPHLGASLGNEGMGVPPLIPGFSRKMRGFLPPFPNITYIL